MNITKGDICSKVSKKTGVQATETKKVFDAIMDEVFSVLSEGKRIEIRGFGVFKVRDRKYRMGRNPRTGEEVPIPQLKVPIFKFSRDGLKVFGEKLINRPLSDTKTKSEVIKPKPQVIPSPNRFEA